MKNFKKTILLTLMTFIAMGISFSEARESILMKEGTRKISVRNRHLNLQIRKAASNHPETPPLYDEEGCTEEESDAYDRCMEQTCSDAPNDSESMECDDYCVDESGCELSSDDFETEE